MSEQVWKERAHRALALAIELGQVDGAHHKMWVIDQMVRELTGEKGYEQFLEIFRNDNGGYDWDGGIAP